MENLTVVISVALSALTFFIGRLHGARTEGEKQGILLNQLENIKHDIQELKTDFKQINVEKIHTELNYLKIELGRNKTDILKLNERIDIHITEHHKVN